MNEVLKRCTRSVKNAPGVYRYYLVNEKGRLFDPPRGPKYLASRISNGVRTKETFSTLEEARAYIRGDSLLRNSQIPQTHNSGMRFSELLIYYRDNILPHLARSTQVRNLSLLKKLEFFNNFFVTEIMETTVVAWITVLKKPENLAQQNKTRRSFKHESDLLKVVLKTYRMIDPEYRLPFEKLDSKILTVKEKGKTNKDLTPPEARQFFTALFEDCEKANQLEIFYLAKLQYLTCTRVQEAAALHVEDFDFEKERVTINKRIIWTRARGDEPILQEGTKANSGKIIPLFPELAKTVRQWLLKSGVRHGPIFKLDGKFLSYRQIEYRYSRSLEAIGSPFRGTHILRHASISEAHEGSNGDILVAKALAGHSSIKSTEKYAKVRTEHISKVAEAAFGLIFSSDSPQLSANSKKGKCI